MPTYTGDNGNNNINGSSGNDIIAGLTGADSVSAGSGDDQIDGGNGEDVIDGGDGDDVIHGGNGIDQLSGGGGNDAIFGDHGNDHITGGAGDDLIDGNAGFDTAYYSGNIDKYSFFASSGYLHVLHLGGAGPDGHDRLIRVERLVFADRVIDLTGGTNNRPVAVDDMVFIDEDAGTHSSGSASVRDNDFDFEGQALTVTGGTFTGTYGTLTLNADGTYSYTQFASTQAMAAGENVQDSFDYTVSDGSGTDTGTIVFNIAGVNDAPTANPDSGTTGENESITIDVLANDDDIDNGAVLTVTAASAPAGQGIASVVGGQVQFDPGTDFDDLAAGASEEVVVGYDIQDEHGATASSTITITVTGVNDAPVAADDTASIAENGAAILVDVLANDSDADNGAVLTLTAASAPAGQGIASVVGNQVQFDPGTDFDDLAAGATEEVIVSYDIEDEHGATDSATLTIIVTGANDGPTASPDSGTTDENAVLLIDVLANDDDIDNGAVLTVTAASAPPGQGIASVVGNQVEFDPGTDFDDLAVGDSEEVVVSYDIEDEQGATASSTITIIVTGTNDGPVANPDTGSTIAREIVTVDVLANDEDVDEGAVLTVVAASAPAGQGIASVVGNQVRFDPGEDFDYLADGETAVVVIDYVIEDEHGVQSLSTLTITVEGQDDGSIVGTNQGETIVGTPGDDRINALGGDDTVFALAGDDFIRGGDGLDTLNGEAGSDVIEGGEGNDIASGGDGFDNLSGEAGNDNLSGGNDGDVLAGGDGNDQLFGQAGDDGLRGEEGADQLFGGDGFDDLGGGAGNDSLSGGNDDDFVRGGDGDDSLDGDGGNDILSDLAGTNSFAGGLGGDLIEAGSSDGVQTIDGGDGNDTIRHYYRHNASIITTGSGSDTIEIAFADQGTEAIIVTDFTPGGGGDMFRLSGDEGALLDLLAGWDGSSNPFGSGFLRLEQSGDHTLLQWDRNGADGGAVWETLAIFQDTVKGAFTDANFVPGYHPDGSPPAGQTINGTNNSETLNGTVGSDTINALGGADTVNGLAGNDLINGGDGADQLNGQADDDTVNGGNDDDILSGGDGDDHLFGQAGNDMAGGGNGDDQLSGGDGDDSLNGGVGGDGLDGGAGDDILTDYDGTNSLAGGLGADLIIAASTDGAQTILGGDGNDTIRHYYRHYASTITTGDGSDTIEIAHADQGNAAIIVTDFATGAGGDVFRLSGDDGGLLSLLSGWDGSSNPFATGFLRLVQSDGDTVLEWDQDGEAGGANWQALVVFQGTNEGDFTEANFDPAYSPGGDPPTGETINGTNDSETLVGTIGDDIINALGGEDYVFGLEGADSLYGGDDLDNLYGGADDDLIDGGNGDDIMFGEDGNDLVLGQAGNDLVFGEAGDDTVDGGGGLDNLSGDAGSDSLSGGSDDDYLSGGDDGDFLSGGSGFDLLAGGEGDDVFAFQSASEGPDEIVDFTSGADRIQVLAEGFGGGLVAGGAVTLVSGSDPTASGDSGQFLYDTDDGRLLWDADGNGSGEALLIATLSSLPPLEASDIVVIGNAV